MSALKGITILDLSRTSPGQDACCMLGDMGADVIFVGEPGYARRMGYRRAWSVGRSNRCILLNLREERGREIFYQLVKRADVVVEGFRPGVARRLGVDYETLQKHNPRIIYCSLSGWGQEGPYRDVAAHDLNYQGIAGMLPLDKEGRPMMPTTNWCDRQATMNLMVAILTALLARERLGVSQYVDTSYVDAAVTLPAEEGHKDPRAESVRPGGPPGSLNPPWSFLRGEHPCYNIYQCRDGKYLTLGIIEPWFWERLCRYFGKEEWIPHQRATGALAEEMFAFFRKKFMEKDRDEWVRILIEEVDTQASAVNLGYEVTQDPHLRAREAVVEVDIPGGKMWQIGIPYKFSKTPGSIRRPVTLAGEDTIPILKELGYSQAQIDELLQAGIVETAPTT